MLNILCVCGNGMGTSTLMKVNLKKICVNNGIDANIESCAFGEATAHLMMTDLVITSPEWASMLPQIGKVKVAVTKNLIDFKGMETTLLDAVRTHYPKEIK